jgi:hypothetical protein
MDALEPLVQPLSGLSGIPETVWEDRVGHRLGVMATALLKRLVKYLTDGVSRGGIRVHASQPQE